MRAISETVRTPVVASLARLTQKDIDTAWDAVRVAQHPRIHVFIATSPIHMQYKLKMSPNEVIERVRTLVAYTRGLVEDVEFSAEDATRSEWDFLARVFTEAVRAGATTLNVPDTVGYTTPDEMFALIQYLRRNVEGAEKVVFLDPLP